MISPLLYEINTRCWLHDLTAREGRRVTLADIPDSEFEYWQHLGFTDIWLMGVWRSGPRASKKALHEPHQQRAYSEALPGWTEADVGGSPYAISEYAVPDSLGGDLGLQQFRERLHHHGLRLILDFVPNHLGLDHAWVGEQPELFVQTSEITEGFSPEPTKAGLLWLAHGKDPHFAPWNDTVQLDYRRPETHRAMVGLLQRTAQECDGVRCDMAMLLLNDVFARTWQEFPSLGPPAEQEFWAEAIAAVKQEHSDFLFLAEVYWGLEPRLQGLGFDYTYDKELYDHLIARDSGRVRRHVLETRPEVLARGARFLENHDERRIASALPLAEHQMAAVLILSLPGLRLLHEGQLQGWKHKTPVQLTCRAREPALPEIKQMYEHLLGVISKTAIGQGTCKLLSPQPISGEHGSPLNIVAIQWNHQSSEVFVVVLNLATHAVRFRVRPELGEPAAHTWSVEDVLIASTNVQHSGAELQDKGYEVNLDSYGVQVLRFRSR